MSKLIQPISSTSSLCSISCILSDGQVYACGRNDAFQIPGSNGTQMNFVRIAVGELEKKKVKYLSVGYRHCLAITEKGELIAWGSGSWMVSKITKIPTLIPMDIKIKFVVGGFSHSFAISENDHLYSWGANSFGELGLFDYDIRTSPSRVNTNEKKIIHVVCGAHFTVILTGNILNFHY